MIDGLHQIGARLTRLLVPEADARGEVPIDSIIAFRILYGAVMMYSLTRFALSGWVHELWIAPTYFFKYEWAGWMPAWEPLGLYVHLGLTWLAALAVTLGLYTRLSLVLFGLGFLGLQLIDKTNYLNHYYLVLCLLIPLGLCPVGAAGALDQRLRRHPAPPSTHAPAWCLALLRFQIAIVYVFAAIAKLEWDWLWYAQPLSIWLSARGDLPLVGGLITQPEVAYLMSWCGFLYDLTIVGFLYWRRARPYAYLVVISFHGATWALFDIGIFPLLMTSLTPIFFDPRWPQRIWGEPSKNTKVDKVERVIEREAQSRARPNRALTLFLSAWCAFHLIYPLRTLWLEESVLWSERGMRYSWRVMLREKMGSVTYRVRPLSRERVWEVSPRRYLRPRQLSEMSSQPDMIKELAYTVARDAERRLGEPVAVYADVWVSLNGRSPKRLINPQLDLIRTPLSHPELIMPPPLEPPLLP